MKKRFLALFTAGVLSISLLAGCSGDTEQTEQKSESESQTSVEEPEEKALTKVTLNEVAHSIFYAPMYVAIEEGYFEDEGIDLDLVCGFGADKTKTAVISGEADLWVRKHPFTRMRKEPPTMSSTSRSSLREPGTSLLPGKKCPTSPGRI